MTHVGINRHTMSSNFEVIRICEYCNKEFTAKTTVTKYCSKKCNTAHYKAKKRAEKIEQSKKETSRIKNKPIENLKAKEFLNINEVCKLIGISRRTVYRLITKGELNPIKIGTRTIIKRSALNKYLDRPEQHPIIKEPKPVQFDFSECYTITEIQNKYNISEKGLHKLIKRNNIPKIKKGWYSFVPKQIIDELLT